MKTTFLVFFICTFHPAMTQYTTDDERTETLEIACEGVNRSEMLKRNQTFDRSVVENALQSLFHNFDSDELIRGLLEGQDVGPITREEMRKNVGVIIVNWGFFIIPIIVSLFLLPLLLCCCVCPDSCPAGSCRQPQGVPYTSGQMSCPAVCIIFLTVLLLIAAIIILLWRQTIWGTYSQIRCNTAIIFDDLLNGNVTADEENFFIGIDTVSKQLERLNNNMEDIQTTIHTISPDGQVMSGLFRDIDEAEVEVSSIPTGVEGEELKLEYPSPLDQDSPSGRINSELGSVLGSSKRPGLIQNEHIALNLTKASIMGVSAAASGFEGAVSVFQLGFQAAQSTIADVVDSTSDLDLSIHTLFIEVEDRYIRWVIVVFYVLVGLIILMTLFTFLSTIMMCCCDRSACRCCLYSSCVCLSLLGFLMLVCGLFFVTVAPVGYMGCKYLETGLEGVPQFERQFGAVIQNDQLVEYIGRCLPGEDGLILEAVLGESVYGLIGRLDDVMNELQIFDSHAIVDNLHDSHQGVTQLIQQYQRAEIIDIDSTSDVEILRRIARPDAYPSCEEVASSFSDDSWVPSVSQPVVQCSVGGQQVTPHSCPDFSQCRGCIDTYLMLEGMDTVEVGAVLDRRYSESECSSFSRELTNIWANFYHIKQQTIGAVVSRSSSSDGKLNQIGRTIEKDVGELFQSTYDDLVGQFSSIVDPKYGMLGGLNCRVLGEDIQLFVNTVCNHVVVLSYFLAILSGISAYFILFIACFVVCLGVRHYRREQSENPDLYDRQEYYPDRGPPSAKRLF